jgi:dipeptide transport system substrate-binding protein
MMFGWSADNGDSDNFLGPILSCEAVKGGGNVSRWCNKDFEDAYVKAKLTSKTAERAKLYEKAQEIEHEEVPQIEVAHSLRYTPVRKEVIGFKMDITAHHYFKYVDLAK